MHSQYKTHRRLPAENKCSFCKRIVVYPEHCQAVSSNAHRQGNSDMQLLLIFYLCLLSK